MFMEKDTICAIATALGNSGINIIRISGGEALNIARKIFVDKNNKSVNELKNRFLNYGKIVDNKGNILDEVLVTYMKAPKTFTCEDIVEINCHGGVLSAKKILDLILENNCRIAESGEFTKRAFLNGRIDLTQAEAIIDIINAKSERAHEISVGNLEGRLSKEINFIIDNLLDLLANIEVNIDFPEYDEDDVTIEKVREKSTEYLKRIEDLIKTSNTGKIFKDGINTLILGKPNVGKSSLMNFLLNENRAIVTEIPGTTRDTIEEQININGILLNIIDTAGIRDTEDVIEKIGVDKAINKISQVDLIIMVFDSSRSLDKNDIDILKLIEDKKVIYIKNKSDLEDKLDLRDYSKIENEIISISIKQNKGLNEIESKIENMFFNGKLDTSCDLIVSNARQKSLLINSANYIREVIKSIENGMTIDFIEIDLKSAVDCLGQIVGKTITDDLMDKIFSDFCIGK